MDLYGNISEEQFDGVLQIIQFAVCHWAVEDFWSIFHEEKDYHGTDYDHKLVNKQFKEWTKNPFKFVMSLDVAYRHHFFEKAREQLQKALSVAS